MSDVLFSVFPNERFVDLSLFQYGYEKCDPLHSYGPYIRNHYLFHYIISGKGVLNATDSKGITRKFELAADSGFLIYPGLVNTYYADEHEPWEYTWIEFDGIKVRESLVLAGLDEEAPVYMPNYQELGAILRDELLYIASHSSASPLNLTGHLYLALDALITSSASKKRLQEGRLRDFYVREAIGFIEQNYARSITVEDMARGCSLNRSYFGKIFKEALSQSPQEFLIHFRMSKAAEQLKTTDLPISKICISVGYPNQLHFSRAFKNVYGISPSEYRLKNKIREQ